MAFDAHKNFSYSTVLTAPSPAASGTSLVVAAADGTKFPAVSFNATVWPAGVQPTTANAEIVRVTTIATDTFTITRAQESTSARTIVVGDQIAATITVKTLTDVEASNPMTTLGDTIYEDATPAAARLAGNITSTKKFLVQTGTGAVSAVPSWATIAAGDVPTLNQDTTGKSAKTDALNSATTLVNVSAAAAPTANQVLTATSGTAATWQAAGGGTSTPTMNSYTDFAASTRFDSQVGGSGLASFASYGMKINTDVTSGSFNEVRWYQTNSNSGATVLGSPTFSCQISCEALNAASGAGSSYFGLAYCAAAVGGHTYTTTHIGFKLLKAGGVVSLYATQGDGTTENASAALTTVVDTDVLDLIVKVNGTASADYYWRKNGGSLSSATNLTANMPTTGNRLITFSVSNNNTAFAFTLIVAAASYQR